MPGNSFGNVFRITTWGESHGPAIGVVIDGCPSGIKIDTTLIQKELDRRRPGQSEIVSPRKEGDKVEILSGVFENKTTGTPISLVIRNADQKSGDYSLLSDKYRPSHADFVYDAKYGIRDHRGGGRASARETVARVASGAIAKSILQREKTEVIAYIKQIHKVEAVINPDKITSKKIEGSLVRCPDSKASEKMIAAIKKAQSEGDSLGGIVECVIRNVPIGLGSPVFEKLDARLAAAMLSIPAVKGFEIGTGFSAVKMKGSEHNDPIVKKNGKVMTSTNHSGGIVGGISNGMDIIFRVVFKPTATIFKKQNTINRKGESTTLQMSGRHDPCVVPRAVPIVEAMAALVLADEYLIHKTLK